MIKQGPESGELRSLYENLKKQHSTLLQKNQNDLIKIKMRQKQLNQKIAAIQLEKEQLHASLTSQIQALLQQIAHLHSSASSVLAAQAALTPQTALTPQKALTPQAALTRQSSLQSNQWQLQKAALMQNMKSNAQNQANLTKQINALKKEHVSALQNLQKLTEGRDQTVQLKLAELQGKVESFSRELQKQKQKNRLLQLSQAQLKLAIERKCHEAQDIQNTLQHKLIQAKKALQQELQTSEQLESLIAAKQQQLRETEQKYAAKIAQKENEACPRCEALQQQLELNAEMLKSVRMMLKFKEIQLQAQAAKK